jgi:hypothetical protein
MFKSTRQISGFGDTSRELEENTGQGFAPCDRLYNDAVTMQVRTTLLRNIRSRFNQFSEVTYRKV